LKSYKTSSEAIKTENSVKDNKEIYPELNQFSVLNYSFISVKSIATLHFLDHFSQ
jgi:hypothetical protein